MAELRKEMENLNCENVVTLLNSGNILFNAETDDLENLEKIISEHLEKVFGFAIPTILRSSETILRILEKDPFRDLQLTKDIRLYVSFLRQKSDLDLKLPWSSEDGSYKIIAKNKDTILSVLDISVTKTPQAMDVLKRYFGSDITTRNWNTINRIGKKLEAMRE